MPHITVNSLIIRDNNYHILRVIINGGFDRASVSRDLGVDHVT